MATTLDKWAKSTTCHGVYDIFHARSKKTKALWIFLVLISFSTLTYELVSMFDDFFNSKKWSSDIHFEDTGSLPYPVLTICDFNRLRRSKVKKYNFKKELIEYLFFTNGSRYTVFRVPSQAQRRHFTQWRKTYKMRYTEIFDKMGNTCEEIFQFASVHRYHTYTPCTARWLNITPLFTIEYGKCYQLKLGIKLKARLAGRASGLSLILNFDQSEYLPVLVNNYNDEGFAFQLNHGDGVKYANWLTLSPGLRSWVSITLMKFETTTSGFNLYSPPCIQSPKLKVISGEYSRKRCEFDCIMAAVVSACGCVYRITTPAFPTCDMDEFDKCSKKTDGKSILSCRNQCSDPCEEYKITASVSYSRAVSQAQQTRLEQDRKLPKILNNSKLNQFVAIEVYYETLAVTVIERQETTTLSEIVSHIGGQLGLWAGISVITIYQTIYYLLQALCDRCFTNRNPLHDIQ